MAAAYQDKEVDCPFGDLAAQIQLRRAQHYVLVHEYHYVEGLLRKGQIEEKEVVRIKAEIDKKLIALQSAELLTAAEEGANLERSIMKGGLANIFDSHDLEEAFGQGWADKLKTSNFPEGKMANEGKLLYVASGACVERRADYEGENDTDLTYTAGHMAYWQNL